MGRKLSKNSENASILLENSQKLSQKLVGRNFKKIKQVHKSRVSYLNLSLWYIVHKNEKIDFQFS